jgi:hypothetical protein
MVSLEYRAGVMKMETIQACVNPKLLARAQRLFTGTRDGRIIELLQNARRAGATKVEIENVSGQITVRDNGAGVEDFAKLLDMGGSGWPSAVEGGVDLEASEDPAGVGLFCLAPRKVMIRTRGKKVVIDNEGWTGQAVAVEADPQFSQGTELIFEDDPWNRVAVEKHAVFSGLTVVIDGETCAREAFLNEGACASYPELGCKIEVRPYGELGRWHKLLHNSYANPRVLINFHGQMVELDYQPVSDTWLTYLVEMTGQPTGIRLMLPARTRLVENPASDALRKAIELEAYRHIQRQATHRLSFPDFQRAKAIGVELPEAEPVFEVGLLDGCDVQPSQVNMPKDFPLAKCYRLAPPFRQHHDTHSCNAHLLAALGKQESPFVPVTIDSRFDGYSWANLPTIDRMEVRAGKMLQQDSVWQGQLACVASIELTAYTSDGKFFRSAGPLAIEPPKEGEERKWYEDKDHVLVTPEARKRLDSSEIWYHLGGFDLDGDSYDTQSAEADRQLRSFWCAMIGPDEELRVSIFEAVQYLTPEWKHITIQPDGQVVIAYADGTRKRLKAPKAKAS